MKKKNLSIYTKLMLFVHSWGKRTRKTNDAELEMSLLARKMAILRGKLPPASGGGAFKFDSGATSAVDVPFRYNALKFYLPLNTRKEGSARPQTGKHKHIIRWNSQYIFEGRID